MVGNTVSKYRIVEKIGQGGTGHVYKALDLTLNRPVALKFLSPDLRESPEQLRRFEQEAVAISSLNHPNIAVIHEIDTVDGQPFIVFEYLPGGTLRAKLLACRARAERLPVEAALRYAVQICSALAHAHERGVIHRDIKSGNVMLAADDWIKVTDFGLARLAYSEHITQPGWLMGTIAYMSPEQASGREVDKRSDLFSTGVVLYEMLTGELPFTGSTQEECRRKVIEEQQLPPRRLRPELPAAVEAVVQQALAKDPGARFQTASRMQAQLEPLLRESTLSSSATSETVSLRTAPSRGVPTRRVSTAVAAVVLLLCAALLWNARGALSAFFAGLPDQKSVAVLKFENIGADAANEPFCQGLMEMLSSKLTQLEQFQGALSVVPASEVRRESVTSARLARQAFGVNLVISGSVQRTADGVLLTANVVDARELRQLRSRHIFVPQTEPAGMQEGVVQEVADLLELELRPEARAALAEGSTTVPRASDFYLQGRGYLQAGSSGLDEAITLFERSLQLDPQYPLALAGLGEAYWRKYLSTRDRKWVDAAWEACDRAVKLNPRVAAARTTLAMLYGGTGRHEEAIREAALALRLDPLNREASAERARALEALGRLDEAEAQLKKTVSLRPGFWNSYVRLGTYYLRHGKYAEAESAYKRVIELVPDNASGYANLGALYHLQGREREAEQMLKRALDLRPTPETYSNLATVYFFQGRYADAVPIYEKLTSSGSNDYIIWGNLGDAYRWSPGHAHRAEAAYRKAERLAADALAVNPTNADALSSLALYHAKLGDRRRAVREAEKAIHMARDDTTILFNATIVCEVAGKREDALRYMELTLQGGYSINEIMAEPELRQLRRDARFAAIVRNAEKTG